MKKIIFILLVTLAQQSYAQKTSNKYVINYLEKRISSDAELQKISTYPKLIKDRMLKQIHTGEEKYLIMDTNKSVYSLQKPIKTKEKRLENDPFSDEPIEKTTYLTTSENYKRLNDSSLIITKNIMDSMYVIKTDLHPFKWELLNETKRIHNMSCQKATGLDEKGNTIEAWYTEEIPISNGPSIYGGLPGLIIQLTTKYRFFELNSLAESSSIENIQFPSEEHAITLEDFKKQFNPKDNKPRKVIKYN